MIGAGGGQKSKRCIQPCVPMKNQSPLQKKKKTNVKDVTCLSSVKEYTVGRIYCHTIYTLYQIVCRRACVDPKGHTNKELEAKEPAHLMHRIPQCRVDWFCEFKSTQCVAISCKDCNVDVWFSVGDFVRSTTASHSTHIQDAITTRFSRVEHRRGETCLHHGPTMLKWSPQLSDRSQSTTAKWVVLSRLIIHSPSLTKHNPSAKYRHGLFANFKSLIQHLPAKATDSTFMLCVEMGQNATSEGWSTLNDIIASALPLRWTLCPPWLDPCQFSYLITMVVVVVVVKVEGCEVLYQPQITRGQESNVIQDRSWPTNLDDSKYSRNILLMDCSMTFPLARLGDSKV